MASGVGVHGGAQEIEVAIRDALLESPDADPRGLAKTLTERLGRIVPVQAVIRVKGSLKRSANVNQAREQASGVLADNLGIMNATKLKLLAIFNDETLPLPQRLEASKELRQWTTMEVDAAGIEDAESDTLFVIGGEWSLEPQ